MYPVSQAFLEAVKQNTRRYYWTGRITTKTGVTYSFGPEDIVKGREFLLDTVDFLDGDIAQSPGGSLIGALCREQGIDAAALIEGDPFFNGLEADLPQGTIRKLQRFSVILL